MSAANPAYTESTRAIQLLQKRMDKLVVQEFKKSYLFTRLKSSGNVLNIDGPAKEIPFYVTPPALGKWVDRADALPDASSQKMAMGFATNRYAVVPLGWDDLEQWENEGNPDKIFDTIDLKSTEQAWAMFRTLATAAWSAAGGKAPDGLTSWIEAAAPGSQTATFMGVNKGTKAWFRNAAVQLTQNFGYLAPNTNLFAGFLALLQLQEQTTVGTLFPSDFITTQTIFNLVRRAYMESSTPFHMISDVKNAEFGFERVNFNGTWLGWDSDCPADKVYALHIDQNSQAARVNNDPRDKTVMDTALENIAKNSIFEMSGALGLAIHPRIQNRKIAPRSPYRRLSTTEWLMTSMNLWTSRMDHGVAYSDNGSRWSTW